MLKLLLLWTALQVATPPELPKGQIVPDVRCLTDASQGYALYLPSSYSPGRAWPVIFAFDPGGRGLNGVERYKAAAEKYGYIVAGSNNSRNGSPDTNKAVLAMTSDVLSRLTIDATRIYTAGMSGGARVAFSVALASPAIAGVLASSAGYPDEQRRQTLTFPVFATAGTEDFNHVEMRLLDQDLKTPHRLEIFLGGHVWLSSELAMAGVEWMEIQAIRSGKAPKDTGTIESLFKTRLAGISPDRKDKETFLALQSLVADFDGLRDVKALTQRVSELAKDKNVKSAIKADRDEDEREMTTLRGVFELESRLNGPDRAAVLESLRGQWKKLSEQSKLPQDSAERRIARRVLANLSAGGLSRDPEYVAATRDYRVGRGAR